MSTKKNTTTYDKVVEAYRRNFNEAPFWQLFEGTSDKGARIDTNYSLTLAPNRANPISEDDLDNDDGFTKSLNRLNDTIGEFESGIFTIYFLSSNDNKSRSSSLQRTFQLGDATENSSFLSSIGGFSAKNKGGDLMQQFFMASAIRGLESGKSAEMMRLELEIERLKLRQEHEKDLERLESTVPNRIMGFVDENADRVLDLVEKFAPALALGLKSKMPPSNLGGQTKSNENNTYVQPNENTPLHEFPLDYNLKYLSSDQFLIYAAAFKNNAKLNPNVAFAKMVYFSSIDPDMFNLAINMMEERIQEAKKAKNEAPNE